MTPLSSFRSLVPALNKYRGHYALCGGLASSFYRETPRLTNDLDIAIDLGSVAKSRAVANEIIKKIGLVPTAGWIANSQGKISDPKPLVIGRKKNDDSAGSIDLLLPAFPWISSAVRRAQFNLIDFGLGDFPVISVEDLIISKLFALGIEPTRFSDLDDLQSIFRTGKWLDLTYLKLEFERLELRIPLELKKSCPKELLRIVKRIQ